MSKVSNSILKSIFSAVSKNDPPPPRLRAEKVRNILIVNTTDMGDTLLSTPAIRNIRKNFPKAVITSLASKDARAALLGNRRIDGFIEYPERTNFRYLMRLPSLVMELRKGRFDLVIVLNADDPGPLVYLTGATWRMKINRRETRFPFLYSFPVKAASQEGHEVDMRLRNLGLHGIKAGGRDLELFLNESDHREAGVIIDGLKRNKRGFIVVHPFGGSRNKWWDAENVKGFCELIRARLGLTPVIAGGAEEAPFAVEMAKACGAVSAAGKLSARGTAALIYGSELIVTTDSCPMLMAQALHVPTVALFGPDDPEARGPVNRNDIVIRKELPCSPCGKKLCQYPANDCMVSITPEDVLGSVQKRLSRRMCSFI